MDFAGLASVCAVFIMVMSMLHMNGASLCSCDLACIHPSHKMDTEPIIPCICIKMENSVAKILVFVLSYMGSLS